jgi:hypothetical protein
MNAVRTLLIVLLAAAIADAQVSPRPNANGWGPSWIGGGPPGGNPRPKKLENCRTAVTIGNDRSEIGINVRLWGDADVEKGNEYQLSYQLRLHTKKGEAGPILGTADKPSGISNPVTSSAADDAWNGLEGTVDVNRKDISGMTNLPADQLAVIRIEPHLYDVKAARFLTPGKTPAIIVMASVGKNGRVDSVVSLRSWIAANARYDADKVLDKLADLDEYDLYGNGIGEAIGQVLAVKEIPTATKVRFIKAVPKEVVNGKSSPGLWGTLSTFAAGEDADLKTAAKTKLAEGF